MLVVLAILGIIAALGVWSYLAARTPARDAARTVHAHLLTLRSQAMSNTQARRLVLTAGQELVLQSALRCSETDQSRWTRLGGVTLPPPSNQVTLAAAGPLPPDPTVPGDTRLVVCFGPRGLAEPGGGDGAARFLTLRDHKRTYRLEVALNGAVRTRVE
ncbi:type II secretory pathway pseudopilin PulG [Deinococcus budaensis]|uniref:Type II secretory pathway pseudopilin PulG n=1 Tax=Deinococcus budaensis TaxID=1665626 RepID=A0A7W8GFB1_9DEIO|nr:type II secretion system protein [Deinococcus budaensis]MBB5234552.1 type II secretory pathway pseudopilin PulG [Deinococcus budaensis]